MYEIVRLFRAEGEAKLPDQRRWLERIVATPPAAVPKDGGRTVDQASFDLSVFKLHGLGGLKDLSEGRRLIERAAMSGNVPQAPYMFGIFYDKDGGEDYATARLWFERAAKSKARSQCHVGLGATHKEGAGVPKNTSEARKWLKMAADRGLKEAPKDLATLGESTRRQQKRSPGSNSTTPLPP
jgi:TPR repeat protein